MITTWTSGRRALIFLSTSIPPGSGRFWSRRTSWKSPPSTRVSASAPSDAVSTRYPSSERLSWSVKRSERSSSTTSTPAACLTRVGASVSMSFLHGKVDRDGGPLSDGALDGDHAAVLAHDGLADGKAEPAPLRAGREERVEDAGERGGGNPGAVVAHRDLDHLLLRNGARGLEAVRRPPPDRAPLHEALPAHPHRDADLAPLGERLDRVLHDVHQHLEDLVRVHVDLRHALGLVGAERHLLPHRRLVHQRERLLERGKERLAREARRGGARELEEALHDAVEPRHFLDDQRRERGAGIVGREAPGQDLGRVADPGERIPDLVGDARGERPDRGEPVAAPPLLV